MRKLNVKKLAAIGVGVALMGMALAPVATAALNSNLDTLTKGDVVSDSGVPVVDIVAGSSAAASDWMWAGNIAAKVAQLATSTSTVSVTGGEDTGTVMVEPTDLSVDITLGGERTYSTESSKRYNQTLLNSDPSATSPVEFSKILTSSQLPFLMNETSSYKVAGSNYTQTIKETIGISADAKFNYTTVGVHDFVLNLGTNDFNYTITFSKGLPITDTTTSIYSATKFQDGTDDDVDIPWFGESYTLFESDFTGTIKTLKLIKEQEKITFYAEQEITDLDGKNAYAGQKMSIKFAGIAQTAGAGTYSADLELYDEAGNLVQTQYNVASGTFLDETFSDAGGDVALDTIVYLESVGTVGGVGRIGVTVGSSLLQIADGKPYPYDATDTDTSDDYWKVTFGSVTDSSSPDINAIKTITVYNNAKYWKTASGVNTPLYASDHALTDAGAADDGVAKFLEGESEDTFGYNFVRIAFDGFDDSGKNYTTVKIGNDGQTGVLEHGYIEYTDTGDFMHQIPFYIDLDPVFSGQEASGLQAQESTFAMPGTTDQLINYRCQDTAATFDMNVFSGATGCTLGSESTWCDGTLNGATLVSRIDPVYAGEIDTVWQSETAQTTWDTNSVAVNIGGMNWTLTDIANDTDVNINRFTYDFNCQFASEPWANAEGSAEILDINNHYDTFYLRNYDDNKGLEVWWGNPLTITGSNTNGQSFEYAIAGSENFGKLYLLLDNSTQFNVLYNKQINFAGTDTGEDGVVGSWGGANGNNYGGDFNYYLPDASADDAFGTSDTTYNIAHFIIDDNTESSTFKWMGNLSGTNIRDFNVYMYVPTGKIINSADSTNLSTYPAWGSASYKSGSMTWNLKRYPGSQSSYLLAGYTDFGSKAWIDEDMFYIRMPEDALKLDVTVLGQATEITTTGGETTPEDSPIAAGGSFTFEDGTQITIDAINYTAGTADVTGGAVANPATYENIVPVGKMVYSDVSPPSGGKVIVGGWLVNALASGFVLEDGVTTLEDALVAEGDAVAQIVGSDIIVAGFNAAGTGTAAEALIDALEALLG